MGPRFTRLLVLVCAVSTAMLGLVGGARANYFGLRYLNNQQEYGDLSSIEVPTAAEQPPSSGEFYLHRVVVQSAISTTAGLVQSGWATVGSQVSFDACGNTNSATNSFVEYRPVNGTYSCYLYTSQPASTDWNFNVYVNSNGWNVKIDGNVDPDGPWHIGAAYGYPMAGGESVVTSASGQAFTCYGDGPSSWNYYNAPNNGGAGSILVSPNSATATSLSGGWSIGTAPSPLCDNLP